MKNRSRYGVLLSLVLGTGFPAARAGGGVGATLELGTASGVFHSPAVMHAWEGVTQIRYTFSEEVWVDFYDLHLKAVSPESYAIALSGFSSDAVAHTATWEVAGLPDFQAERFQVVLCGVWQRTVPPTAVPTTTNTYSLLTLDVSGDDSVSPIDSLRIINHINGGNPYDPVLDVDGNGAITARDALLVINYLNATGGTTLDPGGLFKSVASTPASSLTITNMTVQGGMISLELAGLPDGSVATAEGSGELVQPYWYYVQYAVGTGGISRITFPLGQQSRQGFFRASFQ